MDLKYSNTAIKIYCGVLYVFKTDIYAFKKPQINWDNLTTVTDPLLLTSSCIKIVPPFTTQEVIMEELPNIPPFNVIGEFINKYQFNTNRRRTEMQDCILRANKITVGDNEQATKCLKRLGYLTDRGYTFGVCNLYEALPENIVELTEQTYKGLQTVKIINNTQLEIRFNNQL